jgi:hypothetical protein
MWQAFFIFIFFSTWHTAGQLYLIIPYKAINANDAQVLYNASCCSLEKRLAPPLRDVASGKLYLEKKERRVESSRGGINYAQHGPVLLTQKHSGGRGQQYSRHCRRKTPCVHITCRFPPKNDATSPKKKKSNGGRQKDNNRSCERSQPPILDSVMCHRALDMCRSAKKILKKNRFG